MQETKIDVNRTTGDFSRATEDYLKAIWSQNQAGNKVTTTSLAKYLGLAASTVSEAIKKLSQTELLVHDPYGSIRLTDKGQSIALDVIRRHRIVESFIHEEIEYAWDEVHDEAEVLEHVVSQKLVEAMYKKLGSPERDPHGDPIPRLDGTLPEQVTFTLAEAPIGKPLEVVRITDDSGDLLRYLQENSVMPGQPVRLIAKEEAVEIVTVETKNGKVALGNKAATLIEVSYVG